MRCSNTEAFRVLDSSRGIYNTGFSMNEIPVNRSDQLVYSVRSTVYSIRTLQGLGRQGSTQAGSPIPVPSIHVHLFPQPLSCVTSIRLDGMTYGLQQAKDGRPTSRKYSEVPGLAHVNNCRIEPWLRQQGMHGTGCEAGGRILQW